MATNPTTTTVATPAPQAQAIPVAATLTPKMGTGPVATPTKARVKVTGGTTSMATATTNSNKASGSNLAAMKQGWFDKCKELGERKGSGTAAELEWFEDMVERAHPPRSEIEPDDAQQGYNAWRAGVDARQGFKSKTQTAGTKAKAVSEAKLMITWGTLPNANAPRVFGLVQSVVNATPSLRGEMSEHLLKVARSQLKTPDQPFTKDDIKHLLTLDPEKPEKTEVEELAVERKRLNAIGEKYTFSNHLRAAVNSISERIQQLGGTMAEKRADEKARKAEAKRQAKRDAKKKVAA